MRVVMSASPGWSEKFIIFHITDDSLLSDYGGMAQWFGVDYGKIPIYFHDFLNFYHEERCKVIHLPFLPFCHYYEHLPRIKRVPLSKVY